MRTGRRAVSLTALAGAILWAGCRGRPLERLPRAVSVPPKGRTRPVVDTPPKPAPLTPTADTTVTGVEAPAAAEHIPPADKQELVMRARLDRLLVAVAAGGSPVARDVLAEKAVSKLTETGLRARRLRQTPGYGSPVSAYRAGREGFDRLIVLRGESRQVDKLGEFFSYEARCLGKMLDPADGMVLASKEVLSRGKRALSAADAERSALEAAGGELVEYLTDELIRKVDHGRYLVRLVLEGVRNTDEVDRIKAWLQTRPGVAEAKCLSWSRSSRTARMFVRMHPAVKGNLAAYVETIPKLKIEVTDLRPRDLSGRRLKEKKKPKRRRK